MDISTEPLNAEVPAGAVGLEGAPPAAVGSSILRETFRLWRARVGLVFVLLIVGVAVIGPFLTPHSPTAFVAPPFAHPGKGVPFGADALGRDVLSRFLDGGFVILVVSVIATVLGVGIGTGLGTFAGYRKGRWDSVLMRSLDVILAFPSVILALMFVSVIGPKLWLIVVSVALTHVPQTARIVRSAVVQLTGLDFISYNENIGVKPSRIMVASIFPNISGPWLVEVSLRLTRSIVMVSSLAFLGFGRQPPAADWGLMINENRGGITLQPSAVMLPIAAVALLTIGVNLIADALARSAAGIDRTRTDA